MALKLLGAATNIFPYRGYNPNGWNEIYNPYLRTPPRLFGESVVFISHFFFVPQGAPCANAVDENGNLKTVGADSLAAVVITNTTAWPGWACQMVRWDAATGGFIEIFNFPYVSAGLAAHTSLSGFSRPFALFGWNLKEVFWDNLAFDGVYTFDTSTLPPSNPFMTFALLNSYRDILVGVDSWGHLGFWDLNEGTLLDRLTQPETIRSLVYEDQDNLWIVTVNGLVAKCNYAGAPRWELLSAVNAPDPTDLGYYCAWDPTRKRLVILRWRPDDAFGNCGLQLEFYRPLYLPTMLTDPVPMNSLTPGGKIDFVAHLIGDAGEGVSPYNVSGELGGSPQGYLRNALAPSALNGALTFRYQAPEAGCTEVLNLSYEVPA